MLGGILLSPLAACERAPEKPRSKPPSDALPPPVAASATGLVELIKLDPTIKLDIHYATAENFTGRVLYPQARVFLQEVAANALVAVHRSLRAQGYGLTIFDGYRPAHVTQLMWDVTPRSKRDYVANPKDGSRHNRGCAVDVTLHDLKTGRQVEMPSAYDDFSARAHQDYMGGSAEATANRARLREAMQAHGFYAMSNEWWHFDHKDWREYPVLNVEFAEI